MDTAADKAKIFFQAQGVSDFSIVSGKKSGWRCRVKLAVRQQGKNLVIGLFQEGSHDIVPIGNCPAHHPRINEAVEKLQKFFLNEKISGYKENTHSGEVRYLQCVVERRTGRVQVTIVLNIPYNKEWEDRIKRLFQKDVLLWHSFWINVQPKPTNTIFGLEWHHVVGKKFLWESLCEVEIPFLPSHFGQANLEMFERLLEDLKGVFPRDQAVVELFSGMGIISVVLRPLSRSITLYEVEPSAQNSFRELLERLPCTLQRDCELIIGDAHKAHEICAKATALIADPPRKGLSGELLETIVKERCVKSFLYISCCWKSFERDAKVLLNGGFTLAWGGSYIFFPETDHLETMCLFCRS